MYTEAYVKTFTAQCTIVVQRFLSKARTASKSAEKTVKCYKPGRVLYQALVHLAYELSTATKMIRKNNLIYLVLVLYKLHVVDRLTKRSDHFG